MSLENLVPPEKKAAPERVFRSSRVPSVLRALENETEGLSLGQIAKATDLSRSTVQRIVDALAEEHLVIGATPTSRVSWGRPS